MKRPRKLLLFDIDGTLVDTGGAGLASLREGFHEAFPEHRDAPFPPLELGGATDRGIVRGLFAHFGIEENGESRRRFFFAAYTARLGDRLTIFSREGRGRVLPGWRTACPSCPGTTAIASGSSPATCARERRSSCGTTASIIISPPTPAPTATIITIATKLGPIARDRAVGIFGEDFAPEHIVVIGDTPRDIACARAFGAKVLAVATGAATRESWSGDGRTRVGESRGFSGKWSVASLLTGPDGSGRGLLGFASVRRVVAHREIEVLTVCRLLPEGEVSPP